MAVEDTNDSEEEQFHDTLPEETPESSPPQQTEDTKLMHIYVQAVRGHPSRNTFTVPVLIAGKLATALVDTGSTHTFMDLKFSTKINCSTTSNAMEKVIVAGGGELLTGAHVPSISYMIQGHTFSNEFKILPLKGYDIVLGGDWLLTHSPVKFDYVAKHIKIRLNGVLKVSLQDNSIHQGVQLMSMDKLHKTLSKGATGYLLLPLASKDTNAQPLPPKIAAVFQDFAEVFEEPTTLPPERECDHTIPLKEGSVPPNI
jgi:predicted aspartyl protease